MKRFLIFIMVILPFTSVFSQNLRAYFTYTVFDTPEKSPYIETYLSINGASIDYKKLDDGNFQGIIDVQLIFKKNDSIVNFAKYDLNSPVVSDTSNVNQNMLDVQRYSLPQGSYEVEITLKDKYSDDKALSSVDKFDIYFPNDSLVFSDIELLSSFEKSDDSNVLTKNGYQLTPYVFNYYPVSLNSIAFYSELYNSSSILGNNEPFLLTYYIRPFEIDKKMDRYIVNKRVKSQDVVVTLSSFDIAELPSGNYLLVMEARDRNNQLLTSKEVFFQRYNPNVEFNMANMLVLNTSNTFVESITNRDSLVKYVDYLIPISTDIERKYAQHQVESASLEELQRYFLNFWTERDLSDPQGAWEEYLLRVMQANKNFASIKIPGYRTDRGRVYLQYGQPNVISDHHFEPAAYPYEIWHYYQLGDQRNKKFVFYTHDIVTNDFQLIHSDAVGELNNYRWQTQIYRRTWDPNSIDDAIIPSTWGSKATQSYRQPW